MSEEEIYDPLSQVQKHMMLRNGILECQLGNFKQNICCCGHANFDHLDFTDLCLSKEPCICDRFLDKESKLTTIPKKQNDKLPQKQKEKEQVGYNQLGYIQTLALNISEGHRW